MRRLSCHLIQEEYDIKSTICIVPSVFVAMIKFIPVKLSEVTEKRFTNHFPVVVMTNLVYAWNVFMEIDARNERFPYLFSLKYLLMN